MKELRVPVATPKKPKWLRTQQEKPRAKRNKKVEPTKQPDAAGGTAVKTNQQATQQPLPKQIDYLYLGGMLAGGVAVFGVFANIIYAPATLWAAIPGGILMFAYGIWIETR